MFLEMIIPSSVRIQMGSRTLFTALICFLENVNRIWANEYLTKSPPFRTKDSKYCRSCVGRKPLFTDLTAADSVTRLSSVREDDSDSSCPILAVSVVRTLNTPKLGPWFLQ